MAKLDFSAINKSAAKSFNAQRTVIKKIARGETVACDTCSLPLQLNVAEKENAGLFCAKGCTQVYLEVEG